MNANNLEELRRSARKLKKLRAARPNPISIESVGALSNPATSVSGSQDSDDDDLEDISSETETPSLERSLGFGVNSISTESLDLFGQRENYLKNNFESLNTDNMDNRKDTSGNFASYFLSVQSLRNKNNFKSQFNAFLGKSITSRYLVRNTEVITAAMNTKSEIEKMKKREELKKRLEDTRRTLKIVISICI